MPLTLVQENSGQATTATVAPALSSAATAGNLLVLCVAERHNTGEPNVITGPSGWTQVTQATATGPATPRAGMWYKVAAGGEQTLSALSAGAVLNWQWWIAEYSGNDASPLDVSTSAGTAGATSLATGTTGTTAQADELAIAMWSIRGDPGTIVGYNNSFTEEGAANSTTSNYLKVATKALSSTGTQSCTLTWTLSGRAAAIIATFKAAPPVVVTKKSVRKNTTAGSSATASVTSDSFTPVAGRIVTVAAGGYGNNAFDLSISDSFGDTGGSTWKQITVGPTTSGYCARSSIFYRKIGTSPGAGTIVVSRTAGTIDQYLAADFFEVSTTTGSPAYAQGKSYHGTTASGGPTMPAALSSTANAVLTTAFSFSDADITQPTSYTTESEVVGGSSTWSCARITNTSTQAVTWTAMGTTLNSVVAVEFRIAGSVDVVLALHGDSNGGALYGGARDYPIATTGAVAFQTVAPNGPIANGSNTYRWSTYPGSDPESYPDWATVLKPVLDAAVPSDCNRLTVAGFSAGGAVAATAQANGWDPPHGTLVGYVYEDGAVPSGGTFANPDAIKATYWGSYTGSAWNSNTLHGYDNIADFESAFHIARKQMDAASPAGPTIHEPMTRLAGAGPYAAPELLDLDWWTNDTQVTDRGTDNENSTSATATLTSATFTPARNSLLVCLIGGYGNDNNFQFTVTDTMGDTGAWTHIRVDADYFGYQNEVCIAYATVGAAPTSGIITVTRTPSGSLDQRMLVTFLELTHPVNAPAFIQSDDSTTAGSANLTLPGALSPDTVGVTVIQDLFGALKTVPTGYTLLDSTAGATPQTAYEGTLTSTSANWGGTFGTDITIALLAEFGPSAGVTVTGTVAQTLGAFTSSAAGSSVTGTSARTLGSFTSTASGAHGVSGTSARTLGSFTSTASGTFTPATVTGTVASTLAAFTSTASGSSVTGTVARTLGDFTSSASGTANPPGVAGSVAETLDAFTPTATGAHGVAGTSAQTLGSFTSTASGTHTPPTVTGTASPTLGNFTSSASGTFTSASVTGTVAATLGSFTTTTAGGTGPSGTAAGALASFSSTASGSSVVGSVTVTLGVFTSSITAGLGSYTFAITGVPTRQALSLGELRHQGIDARWATLRSRANVPPYSILKIGGVYTEIRTPSTNQINSATEVYLGGHRYSVDVSTAQALTAAGYGAYLTLD